jgi:Methyltransferase domain
MRLDPAVIVLRRRSPLEWSAHVRAVLYDGARYPIIERLLVSEYDRALARMVFELDLRDILMFGLGDSTLVMAEALAGLRGGRLTVVEDDPDWRAEDWAQVASRRDVDPQLVASPLFFRLAFGPHHAYGAGATAAVAGRGPYALMLVDAPRGYVGRDGSMHLALPHLAPGALVVVRKEGDTVERWLATYPGLVMLHIDRALGDGTAILGYTGDSTRRLSSRAILTGAVREAYAWIAKRNGTSGPTSVHVGDDDQRDSSDRGG